MAERSTAAVDVADNSGDEPLTAQADQSTADGVANNRERETDSDEAQGSPTSEDSGKASPPELHSGHKLARRYRLEECVTRLDGFSSWRAVDEKLRRAVGVHILPADHSRARSVLAAHVPPPFSATPASFRSSTPSRTTTSSTSCTSGSPDATELTALLASGPLEVYDAYQMVSQVAGAMAAAHREGLAHLRLSPTGRCCGRRRASGGSADSPSTPRCAASVPTPRTRTDTEAIGALLYATLTQRWPYESDRPRPGRSARGHRADPPDQVRAGVHRGLSELAMRALANDGATASRHESPCTTPEELVKAIGEMPRIRPPEPAYTAPPAYQRTAYQQGAYGRPAPHPGATQPVPTPPPPLQSRTGKALKWSVSALLIAALGLGSWQLRGRHHGTGRQGGRPEPDADDGRRQRQESEGPGGR